MRRALIYYWRTQTAVAAAVAVCGAVLTGALLVGDSVRGSLRDLTLDRLGRTDMVLLSERFFRESLADDFRDPELGVTDTAGVILLRGNAVHGSTRTRASQVNVLGISDEFLAIAGESQASDVFRAGTGASEADLRLEAGGVFPAIGLNRTLADELGAEVGDQVLLRFQLGAEVPRDTLLGNRTTDEVVGTIRAQVSAIVPNRGIGRFDLSPHQSFPRNAYLRIEQLQDALEQTGRVNAVVLAGPAELDDALQERLATALSAGDLGLRVRAETDSQFAEISSDEFVLREPLLAAAEAAAARLGSEVLPLQAYLANRIAAGERSVPYSMVLALQPPSDSRLGVLTRRDGAPVGDLADDEIILNSWTAEQLGARRGDTVELDYYVVGIDERLRTETASFVVAGVAAMEGLAADPDVTPEYPGIEGVENIADWDPPFPVDLAAIRPVDEEYWDRYRGTPKAFVALERGRQLWATRYGATTALRIAVPEGSDATTFATALATELDAALNPAAVGFRFLEAKRLGLSGAQGATDFAGLFVAFSFFIIFSALLIVAMLFGLGVDERGREIGTLLAIGFPLRRIRRRFLGEALLVAALGALVGVGAGIGYARLMLWGLTTIWLPAVGSPLLFLHIAPATLGAGFAATVLVVGVTIFMSLRRLRKVPPTRLLAGVTQPVATRAQAGRRARWLAPLGLGAGLGLVALAVATGRASDPGLAFGAGSALLTGGLAAFALWNSGTTGSLRRRRGATARMALRSAGWNPRRSLLSVTLVASACFVIATVASSTRDPRNDEGVIEEGAGGYRLLARSDVPLHHDMNTADGRFDLGFGDAADELLSSVPVVAMRTVPGDDASCLNLYQPQRPRLLGLPATMIDAGGFHFAASLADGYGVDNPWELLNSDLGPEAIPVIGDANSAQWILKLGLGDDLVIANERGRSVRLVLVGTLRESIFQSELLMSEEQLLRHFPSRSGFSFFLIDADEEQAAAVSEALEETLDRFGFDVTRSAQRIADFLVVQNTYLSTFQALGGLGLLLGTLGLGVILVRNVVERRGELATLRALGFPRQSLSRLVLAENLLLLVAGIAIGAGAALVAVLPRLFLGDLDLPWGSLSVALAAVLTIGMTASTVAVALSARIPLLPALKAER